jgi:hypothetical protein
MTDEIGPDDVGPLPPEIVLPPQPGPPRVNFVTLHADGRTICQTGYCTLDHVGDQPKPEGGSLLIVAELPNAVTQEYDPASQAFVPRLAGLRVNKVAALRLACTAAITAGFSSSALGSAFAYPSLETDQANLIRAAQVGGDLWCAAAGVWAMQPHTAAQAQTALADFGALCDAHRAHLAALTVQVNSAATPEAISALAW